MNVLSIGNSFSQDAHRYLHRIARADGLNMTTVNLYISGCSLSRHYRNMLSQQREYTFEMNGESAKLNVSVDEVLLSRDWDVVTVQQTSSKSTDYESYQPYLNALAEHIRRCAPKAKLAVHQTWAYEKDSQRLRTVAGYEDHVQMFMDLKQAYNNAARDIGADLIIPSGQVFQQLIASGIENIHRDTYHSSKGVGRYALGLTWYAALTGRDIEQNPFDDFDEEVSPEQRVTVKSCVTGVVGEYNR